MPSFKFKRKIKKIIEQLIDEYWVFAWYDIKQTEDYVYITMLNRTMSIDNNTIENWTIQFIESLIIWYFKLEQLNY